MKFPPLLITILRILAGMTLVCALLIGWRVFPYLPSNHPPLAAGLPAGWTPAGPDLALQWSDPIVIVGRGLSIGESKHWQMISGHPTFIAMRRPIRNEEVDKDPVEVIGVSESAGVRMLTFALNADAKIMAEIDGEVWVIVHLNKRKGAPYLALQIDPLTGAILEGGSIAPKLADRAGTLWETGQLSYLLVADLGGIVISSFDPQYAPTSLLWRPGEPLTPIALDPPQPFTLSGAFRRSDGRHLLHSHAGSFAMETQPGKLTFSPIGQTVTPVLPVISTPHKWEESYYRDPALQEPPVLLRQTYFSREATLEDWTTLIPLTLQSSNDIAQLNKAIETGIQKHFQDKEYAQLHEVDVNPVYVAQPMTLYTPAGATVLTCDTGAAEATGGHHRWLSELTLFRLNPTEALVTQMLPYLEPGKTEPIPLLRFGLLTASSTQVQWIGWTRLPAFPPGEHPFLSTLSIHADGPVWTLGYDTFLRNSGFTKVAAITTTMPCPPGVTVDGTGWLISSR